METGGLLQHGMDRITVFPERTSRVGQRRNVCGYLLICGLKVRFLRGSPSIPRSSTRFFLAGRDDYSIDTLTDAPHAANERLFR